MTTHRTPVDVAHTAFDALLAHDMAAFTDLFAVDTVMEFPFAPADRPQRLDGRPAVADYLHDYPDLLDVQRIHDVVVHETIEPDVVVAEFAASGVVVADQTPYTARYVAVLTVTDGQIAHYRDYWNPLAFADIPVGLGSRP